MAPSRRGGAQEPVSRPVGSGRLSHEWIDTDAALVAAVAELRDEPFYAIDTEFHRERTYFPHAALVQIAWRDRTVLVDPLAVAIAPLAEVLRGPGVAVAHAAQQDLEVLDRECGEVPSQLFDTQLAAGFVGFSSPSLMNLVERLLGRSLPKGDRLTDWTRRPLTAAQREYAASDVEHLLDLRSVLVSMLEERGRLEWAMEECQLLLERPREPQDPDTAWWRLKDSRSLRGTSRGVAQAVAAWRERRAASLDRPVRSVLPDLALMSIAHRPPRDESELRAARGVEPRHLGGGAGSEILAAVGAGQQLTPTKPPRPGGDADLERSLRPAATLVSAWVGQLSRDLEIDPALVATRADIQALLRGDDDARLGRGWRGELVGEPIRRLVAGEAALAFEPGTAHLVLERRVQKSAGTDS